MNVFFQRGTRQSDRRYYEDLEKTVLNPVSQETQSEIVHDLRAAGRDVYADALNGLTKLWMWGGPAGVGRDTVGMSEGDLIIFMLGEPDGIFKAACRVVLPLGGLSDEISKRIAGRLWHCSDYPEMWAMDRSILVPDVSRRDVGEKLAKNWRFFVGGQGALLPHMRVNINSRPESWFADKGGVEGLLGMLNLSQKDIDSVLAG